MGHGLSGIGQALVGGLLGTCVGSFLGSVAMREPQGWRGLVLGRSCCPRCGATLRARDLVPILSWLAARGRCRHCGAAVPRFYPLVELAGGLVGSVAFGLAGQGYTLQAALLGWWLLALALIDLRSWRLPDALTLPLLALGLLAAALGLLPGPGLWLALLGASLGYVFLAGVAWAYRRLRGRDGLGLGDAKLLAAAGAWLGPAELPLLVLAAALLGLALALLRSDALRAETPVPFGPPLALTFWALFLMQAVR
jgi:leader peptidase (prepilin peptidase)/N-methyltransferase